MSHIDMDDINPQAGQVWAHSEHEFEVTTTKRTEGNVHYEIAGDEAAEQAEAAREFLTEEFGHPLAYVAPIAGSCLTVDEFTDVFDYVRKRKRAPYESG